MAARVGTALGILTVGVGVASGALLLIVAGALVLTVFARSA